MLAGPLALFVASLFTGAALYVSLAEQPARLELDDAALLAEWKLSYARASVLQATLSLIGFALSIVAWAGGKLALVPRGHRAARQLAIHLPPRGPSQP